MTNEPRTWKDLKDLVENEIKFYKNFRKTEEIDKETDDFVLGKIAAYDFISSTLDDWRCSEDL